MEAPTTDLLQDAARLHGQGALAEAATRYRQVLDGEPNNARALYHLAVISCQQGQLHDGIDLARRTLASDPHQPRAHNLLGMALGRLGRPQDALASFDRALAEQPDFADAHGNRAGALMELGRLAEAVEGYERAVALAPNSVGDWLNLGTSLHQLGRHEEAIESFDRALALQANIPQAHVSRGNVLAHLARYEEALASYDRALALDRQDGDALNARGWVLLKLGRVEGAMVNFEEALSAAPDRSGALDRLVDALIGRDEVTPALALVMRALAGNETSATKALFVRCIRNRNLASDAGGVRAFVQRALSEPWDRPADLAAPATSLVKLNPAVKDACALAARAWPRRLTREDLAGRLAPLADDQLLNALLQILPVRDVELERCLTGIRSVFLGTAGEGPVTPIEDGMLRFICALSRQSFLNEYVFEATSDEHESLRRLRERLVGAIASGGVVPVLSLPGADSLQAKSWSPSVAAVVAQQVRRPPAGQPSGPG
jgi:tetratricopeptide (TPR) repeat protein